MTKALISMSIILIIFFLFSSCNRNETVIKTNSISEMIKYDPLPIRSGSRPETTSNIPHEQINVELVLEVHQEMVRRIYSISGIEERQSVVLSWRGMWLKENLPLANPKALIGGREFAHIHDDGSLHIFLEPRRADEAIAAGWAVSHPFAAQGQKDWEGFVMLYTPQSIDELNVSFQLIVDGYNYITGQKIIATDLYN